MPASTARVLASADTGIAQLAQTPHPRLLRMHVAKRLQSLEKGEGLDFATAEALAFGSLMLEGKHVRLCGQDSGRGTFSNRHGIISDQTSAALSSVPLQSINDSPPIGMLADGVAQPGTIEIVNSPLSEYAVVGFEAGIAWTSPDILPMWEAQFGDFNNTAQVTIDTYLGSGETKVSERRPVARASGADIDDACSGAYKRR